LERPDIFALLNQLALLRVILLLVLRRLIFGKSLQLHAKVIIEVFVLENSLIGLPKLLFGPSCLGLKLLRVNFQMSNPLLLCLDLIFQRLNDRLRLGQFVLDVSFGGV
jgi:hypothetical protein